jgi:hypothetical protein
MAGGLLSGPIGLMSATMRSGDEAFMTERACRFCTAGREPEILPRMADILTTMRSTKTVFLQKIQMAWGLMKGEANAGRGSLTGRLPADETKLITRNETQQQRRR